MAYKNFKTTEIIEEIGAELRKIRSEKNLTISFVASELSKNGLHISNTLLGRMENGERRIDDETLFSICKFYNVNPNTVVIAALQDHMKTLQVSDTNPCLQQTSTEYKTHQIIDLYNNLNPEGQREVASLMRLMAYMDAFKKI